MSLLCLDSVSHRFGALPVLGPLTLKLEIGARHAIAGPNGAGKSTLLNVIDGSLTCAGGEVILSGGRITRLPAHKRAQLGISRVFQQPQLSGRHTARGNVLLALARRHRLGPPMWPLRKQRQLETRAAEFLAQTGLSAVAERPAGALSYGQRRQLELTVALAAEPKLLLLDEPTAGLSTHDTEVVVDLLRALPASITLLIVEHDEHVLNAIATSITTLSPPSTRKAGAP
ncbi:MAG TPA: ABC transporter ATP-binding protein [Micromonosporaceae bacterium]|nr:ABC transporter ATP-binding protein [Micromonosporaceae bacterium]HCU49302.1 ABC transporter ATP-binding protein [Micromonosporaceae bacterium]